MASQVLQHQPASTFGYNQHHHTTPQNQPELMIFKCEKSSDNVIVRRGGNIQYVLKRHIFGKRYSLSTEDSKNTLIRAITHRVVGYITFKSQVFALNFNMSFPEFPRGVYTFDIDGVQYLWDYEMNSHLRCFTVKDMKLVAQIFSKSISPRCSQTSNISQEETRSTAWSAKLAIVKDVTVSSGTLASITMTGLLLMKKQIW